LLAAARELAAESKLAEAAELETKLAVAARKDAAAALAEEQAALRCAAADFCHLAGRAKQPAVRKHVAGMAASRATPACL
jgi:hypothetical protein